MLLMIIILSIKIQLISAKSTHHFTNIKPRYSSKAVHTGTLGRPVVGTL